MASIFEPNNFKDIRNLYQFETIMHLIPTEYKLLTFSCWNEKYQSLTNDMTKGKLTGRQHL